MKNLILSFAVICVTTVAGINSAYGQTNKTRFGIKAGIDLMTLGSSTSNGVSINYDSRPGFQGGLYAEAPLSANIVFSPQLLYTQKGGNVKTTISGIAVNGSTQINYLDVPILFGFKLQSNLTFFVGPQIAFLLSQKSTATATFSGTSSTQTDTSTDGMRKTIFGANLGAAYKFNSNVSVDLHYMADLQHAGDGSNGVADTGEKNSGFALSVGFLF